MSAPTKIALAISLAAAFVSSSAHADLGARSTAPATAYSYEIAPRTAFRFDTEKPARAGAPPVAAVHEVLAVQGLDATSFVVRTVRVVYTYRGGGSESVGADVGASADAGASAGGADARAGRHDLGTRWVLLAALGGLLAGGLLAYSRKKREGALK